MNERAALDHPHPARRRWMAILARAEADTLDALLHHAPLDDAPLDDAPLDDAPLDDRRPSPGHTVLRGPEAGLVMTRGRAGGGGAAFNLGEMTVTRCTVRTAAGFIGHAYVAGRDEKRAELAALADALMQDPEHADDIERHVITPLEHQQRAATNERARKAAATQVKFFALQTMRT